MSSYCYYLCAKFYSFILGVTAIICVPSSTALSFVYPVLGENQSLRQALHGQGKIKYVLRM